MIIKSFYHFFTQVNEELKLPSQKCIVKIFNIYVNAQSLCLYVCFVYLVWCCCMSDLMIIFQIVPLGACYY